MNVIESFRDAMQAAGITPPGETIADGILHRFSCSCKSTRNLNGWYLLHADDPANGVFACHKHLQEPVNWCIREYKSLTPEEKSRYTANMQAAKQQRDAERARIHAECSEWCRKTWALAKDATDDHPYLKKKGVHAFGLKVLKDALLIPLRDLGGAIHGLQFVQSNGDKKFKTGSNKSGNFYSIGKPKDNTIIIGEGYSTCASIHQGTGHCVLVAFDSGNLLAVSRKVRGKRPGYKIVLASDSDAFTDINIGLIKATEAARAVNGLLAVPQFKNTSTKPTDFNDLHQLEGLDRVREIIEAAAPPEKQATATNAPSGTIPAITPEDDQESAWPEPLLFGELNTPDIPANILPTWLGNYCSAVASMTQTPPGLSVMFGLAVVATCVQKRLEASSDGDEHKESLSLWTVTALDPGARKTAVKNAFVEPLVNWEAEQLIRLKPEIKTVKHRRDINQKVIDQLKARAAKPDTNSAGREELMEEIAKIENEMPDELIAPRLFTDDVTPERLQALLLDHGERMALLSDEGGIFEIMAGMYSGGKANLNVFLQSYSASAVRVDRQGRSVMLHRPALTFGLTVQPAVIRELSSGNKARFRGTGALGRFLYCLPRSTVGSRDVTQRIKIPEEVKKAYHEGIMGLLAIEPNFDSRGHERARLLTLTPEALRAWLAFSQYVEDRQGPDGEYYDIQDWTGKLPGTALRIAGLLHVVEFGEASTEISEATIERALDLAALLIEHARAAFDAMGNEAAQDDAQTVLRWIVATGKLTFRQNEVIKEIRQFRTVERVEQALKVLTGRNMISEPFKRNTGGRPSVIYRVNPGILPKRKEVENETNI